jgi:heat shock protein HslJ
MRSRAVILLCWAFGACTPAGPSPLGGIWTAIEAPGVVVESKLEAPRFHFSSDLKTLNGVTNCTEFSAPVAMNDRTFAIGEFVIRASVSCTARDHEIENAVVAALRDATEIAVGTGDRLYFRGRNGELVLAKPMPDFPGDAE